MWVVQKRRSGVVYQNIETIMTDGGQIDAVGWQFLNYFLNMKLTVWT
jgi:hypothetical protein